ncbi:MAG TPA: ABC transporter permease [Vicinamibacterales bacterium]|jgi:putative ABC transport system permease protein
MRLYRWLLHLYPASFRHEYGGEMTLAYADRRREADGPWGRAWLLAAAIPEVLGNALAVHADILRQDLRYSARTLARARGFAFTAIVIIALGIGATTAAFSVADFVLLRPLPFPDADRLVMIWQRQPGYGRMELSPANFDDWRRGSRSLDRSGAYTPVSANLASTGEPSRVSGAWVTADLLPTLGVQPALGRVFRAGEDGEGAPPVLIIGDSLWRATFGGDPAVIGQTARLDDEPYTIIGVMPPSFTFPSAEAEFWRPLRLNQGDYQDRSNNFLYGVGRLHAGATLASAQSELSVRAGESRRQFPKEDADTDALVRDFRSELSDDSRLTVLALSGAALCVLLIVCANLANLLIARALGRRQELAVRTAIGAGRERLIRQLVTESVVLSAIGGAIGVALAAVLVPLIWRMIPIEMPTPAGPGVDVRVLVFAAVLTIATAAIFGLAPTLRAGSDAGVQDLREGARAIGGRRQRLRGVLVAAEVVGTVVLLVVTGLLVRALWTLQGRDPGFRADGVLTLQTDLPSAKYAGTDKRSTFYLRLLDQIRALPGVTSAAYISGLPMVWGGGIWPVGINGAELERRQNNTASLRFTTPGFFQTMSIPVRAGRDVSDSDTMKTQMVAVVSESFVKRYWPGQDAIGHHFNFATKDRTIVGVVADIRVRGLERNSEPQVYLPNRQVDDGWFWGYTPKALVVRASTPVAQLAPAISGIIRAADPDLPIYGLRPMTDVVDRTTASRRIQIQVLSGFAAVAFLLAAIGIHGVLSFAVSQRTAEIGIRMALGAQRRDIFALITSQSALLLGAGLVPGVALAYAAGRSVQSLLAGVPPFDTATFASVVALTVAMAAAGTLLPVVRALRIDPLRAIRTE